MTYNMQPFTQGYGNLVGKNPFGTLGNVPNLQNTAHMRFAGDAIGQLAENEKQKYYLKAMEKGMQPQQSQGFGLSQGLDLATNLFGAFSGGFGGGGSGAAIGGAIGGNAGFAGVDSGVLDSVLEGYGGYTSGMTGLY